MNADIDTARFLARKYMRQNPDADLAGFLKSYRCFLNKDLFLSETQRSDIEKEVLRSIEAERYAMNVDIEDPAGLSDPEKHIEWYLEWREKHPEKDRRWNLLKTFLRSKYVKTQTLEQAETALRSIDESSDAVLEYMENPQGLAPFQSKGLVIGYVQSGKTANFTAVIAKAVDAGYKLIIVLAGIHEVLRQQTQDRLDSELTGMTSRVDMPHVNPSELGFDEWTRLTTYAQDFAPGPHPFFEQVIKRPGPILAVMKKNCFVLRKLHAWAESAQLDIRRQVPILIVDDEADQASIDTKYDPTAATDNTDPSKTNELIRRILSLFDRHSYIGYTATPFANVLIDAKTDEESLNRDLYPRNFIVSLPKPPDFLSYMGAEKIFNSGWDKYLVKIITDEAAVALVGRGRSASARPAGPTQDLIDAIQTFLIAGAARRQRGDTHAPLSMLIHTSPLKKSHEKMMRIIEDIINSLRTRHEDKRQSKVLDEELENRWKKDFMPATQEIQPDIDMVPFSNIRSFVEKILSEIKVIQLNHKSEDKLDYENNPSQVIIAVGGNQLSRGLTLHGLLVSLYLRPAYQYDTLLQMGRWFGYRPNYEDLVRIFTTQRLSDCFEHLSLVESDLRSQIARYRSEGMTPIDFAPRIRDHTHLRVTAKDKMGTAASIGGFALSTASTFWLPLDKPDVLQANLELGKQFVLNTHKVNRFEKKDGPGGYLSKNVDGNSVLQFLKQYRFSLPDEIDGAGLDSPKLLEYVERLIRNGELQRWNIGIASPELNSDTPSEDIIHIGDLKIVKVVRNRRRNEGRKGFRVGSMTNPATLRLDRKSIKEELFSKGSRDIPNKPLLVLYFVNKNSKPQRPKQQKDDNKTSSAEIELFKDIPDSRRIDVLGLGFVFPDSAIDGAGYVMQRLNET